MTYNGWSNYETWVTALWLDNDPDTHEFWRAQARECWGNAPHSRRVTEWKFSVRDSATLELADKLKDAIHDENPLYEADLFSDLLSAALSDIDWHELARHYIDDMADEEKLGRMKES